MDEEVEMNAKSVKSYTLKAPKKEDYLIPTTAAFVSSNLHTFVAGYQLPYMVQYDIQSVIQSNK